MTSWKFIIINEFDITLLLTKEKSGDKETIEQFSHAIKILNKNNTNLRGGMNDMKKDIENIKDFSIKNLLNESSIIKNIDEMMNIIFG